MEKKASIYFVQFAVFITSLYGTIFILFDEYVGEHIYFFLQNYVFILLFFFLLFHFFLKVNFSKSYSVIIFTFTVANFLITLLLIYFYQEQFSLQNVIDIFPDSQQYDYNAKYISNLVKSGEFNLISHLKPYWSISDMGYIITIGFVYFLSDNSIFLGILSNLPFLVLNVFFIYKISEGLFGAKIGKSAGLLASVYPYFLFYSVTLLKETIMISILLWFFYLLLLYDDSRTRKNFLILLLPIILLFFFRTFLALILVLSFSYFFFQKSKKVLLLFVFLLLSILFFFPVLPILRPFLMRLEFGYLGEMKEMMMQGYSVSFVANLPMLILGAFFAPFPSLVIGSNYVSWSNVVANGAIIKASLTYFAFWGSIVAYKSKNAVSKTIIFFVFFYVGALVYSSEIFNHRFALLYQPFLIMFVALGLFSKNKYNKTGLLFLYLIFLFFAIIFFNYTKLSIRF